MTPEPPADPDDPIEVDARCLRVVDGLVSGDRAAVAELYRRFIDPLVRRAERRIPGRHRGRILAESVVHSVMESLLDLDPAGRDRLARYRIVTWAQLYGLLARMTLCKCVNRVRRLDAARRAPDAAAPLPAAVVAAGGPAPEDEQVYAELIGKLLDPFRPEELEVLQLRMAGYDAGRIAAEMDLTTPTVRAITRRLQRRVQRLLAEEAAG